MKLRPASRSISLVRPLEIVALQETVEVALNLGLVEVPTRRPSTTGVKDCTSWIRYYACRVSVGDSPEATAVSDNGALFHCLL